MIPAKAFARLLGLDANWEVAAAEYESEPVGRFRLVLHETEKLWLKLQCPETTCGHREVVCHDPTDARVWRHLDACGQRTNILCSPPRARGGACRHVWPVPVPWAGEGHHCPRDFEAFALTLRREMPLQKAGAILGENDTRLWRRLFPPVDKADAALDLSARAHLGVDAMNCRKGHHDLTVFADRAARRVVFATEGKDHTTFTRCAEEILRHNGHPQSLTAGALDMSKADQKGVREELGNAPIVFAPCQVTALASGAVEEVRRREASADPETRATLQQTMDLFRKNPENLTEKEQGRWEDLDLKHLATGQASLIRLELRAIYQRTEIGRASCRERVCMLV